MGACRALEHTREKVMVRVLGFLCYGFAAFDLGLYWLGIADLTGVSWSPIAAAVVGSVLVKAGANAAETAQPQAPAMREN
jgi:apolipoprotein N-acyltransferase